MCLLFAFYSAAEKALFQVLRQLSKFTLQPSSQYASSSGESSFFPDVVDIEQDDTIFSSNSKTLLLT